MQELGVHDIMIEPESSCAPGRPYVLVQYGAQGRIIWPMSLSMGLKIWQQGSGNLHWHCSLATEFADLWQTLKALCKLWPTCQRLSPSGLVTSKPSHGA